MADFFPSNEENNLLIIRFSDPVKILSGEKLNENLNFYINEFENNNIKYDMNLTF